jgi:hypothetical protein
MQLYPKEVPFLVAFRPYAGNWRFTWHIVDNKARDKLRKLKTLEGVQQLAQPPPSITSHILVGLATRL